MDFSNKVVLVTGASGGIGRVTAQYFAKHNANVVVHYNRNQKAGAQTFESLKGNNHLLIQANLTNPETTEQMVDKVVQQMGAIDILVNNAGIYELHPFSETDYRKWQDIWHRTIQVNLIAPANLSFCVIKYMQKQGGGKIINVSSRGAFRGEPDSVSYGASKAGMNAMSQSMAKALACQKIYVYAVAPSFVETEMVSAMLTDDVRNQSPLGRVAAPEDVANTIVFLASEGTEYMTGSIIDINGASYLRS